MKVTLCVEENKIECKESGSDIKAIYQIHHFDLRKQRKNKKKQVFCREKLKIIQKFFKPSLFEIWLESRPKNWLKNFELGVTVLSC